MTTSEIITAALPVLVSTRDREDGGAIVSTRAKRNAEKIFGK